MVARRQVLCRCVCLAPETQNVFGEVVSYKRGGEKTFVALVSVLSAVFLRFARLIRQWPLCPEGWDFRRKRGIWTLEEKNVLLQSRRALA